MPFVDSRLGPGTLTLGATPGTEYGFQVSACSLVPSVDSTDGTPTLADPEPPPLTTTSYALEGTAVNDFADPLGLQRYCFDNDGVETDFVWVPNTPDGASLAGLLTVRAFTMGGDVAVQITTDFSWPVTGKPAWTDAATAAAGSGKAAKS